MPLVGLSGHYRFGCLRRLGVPGVCRGAAGDRRRDGAGNLKPQDRVPTLTPR